VTSESTVLVWGKIGGDGTPPLNHELKPVPVPTIAFAAVAAPPEELKPLASPTKTRMVRTIPVGVAAAGGSQFIAATPITSDSGRIVKPEEVRKIIELKVYRRVHVIVHIRRNTIRVPLER
jgi:hypothetical protein